MYKYVYIYTHTAISSGKRKPMRFSFIRLRVLIVQTDLARVRTVVQKYKSSIIPVLK
jgi:hypothetical protein